MSGLPPNGIFGSLDPSNPQTAMLLGAAQGLGAAAAPSRLPVTAGMAFGSLAGGMMSGAEQGAKLRALNTQQLGDATKAQNDLYNLNLRQYAFGQTPSDPHDLAANRFRQLQMDIPNPGGLPEGQAPGSLTPVAPTATAPGLSAPAAMTKKYEADGLAAKTGIDPYYIGVGGSDLSKAPLDATGFPIWDGHQGSRAAGAFQFEPQTWAKYAPVAGVKDFSPASQIKVFNAAYGAEGWSPWTPYNPQLAQAVAKEAPHGSLAGQSPQTMAPLTDVSEPPGGAVGTPPGAPMPMGGASPGAGNMGNMLADPATRQMMLSQAAFPGSVAQPAVDMQMARYLPPGPMQQSQVLSAMQKMGIPLTKGGDRQNAPLMQVNPDTFLRTGQLSYDVKVPAGYTQQVQERAQAEASGRGAGELQYAGPIEAARKTAAYGAEFGNLIPATAGGAALPIVPGVMGAPTVASPAAPPAAGTRLGLDPATNQPLRSIVPPVASQPLPQSPAEAEAMQKPWAEAKVEMAGIVDPASKAEERLLTQASVYKDLQSGAWQTDKAAFAARLEALGIHVTPNLLNDPAAAQTALHENYQATLEGLKAVNNRFTQREFATLSEYNPQPNLQPATNLQLLSENIGMLRRDQAMSRDWQTAQKQGWRDPVAFESQYMTANPIGPIVNAVAHEIGPLKGMAPGSTAAGAPFSPSGAAPSGSAALPSAPRPPPPNATDHRVLNGTDYYKVGGIWHHY